MLYLDKTQAKAIARMLDHLPDVGPEACAEFITGTGVIVRTFSDGSMWVALQQGGREKVQRYGSLADFKRAYRMPIPESLEDAMRRYGAMGAKFGRAFKLADDGHGNLVQVLGYAYMARSYHLGE